MTRRYGRVIRRLRRSKKMGLRELAKKAKVQPGYLSELERGEKTNPSVAIMTKLARALRVPVTALLE